MKQITIPYRQIRPADVFVGFLADSAQAGVPTASNEFVDVLARLVRKHGRMSARQYAAAMGLGKHTFQQTVVALTGMGPHEWICEYLRLASCELLEKTKWPVEDVARRLGFASSSAFCQFFLRVQQSTPAEYRRMNN